MYSIHGKYFGERVSSRIGSIYKVQSDKRNFKLFIKVEISI